MPKNVLIESRRTEEEGPRSLMCIKTKHLSFLSDVVDTALFCLGRWDSWVHCSHPWYDDFLSLRNGFEISGSPWLWMKHSTCVCRVLLTVGRWYMASVFRVSVVFCGIICLKVRPSNKIYKLLYSRSSFPSLFHLIVALVTLNCLFWLFSCVKYGG